MDESEDNMSADDSTKFDGSSAVKNKPKKRSLVERELETNLTARVTSPVTNSDGSSTSRYGRARRVKSELEYTDAEKAAMKTLVSPKFDKSPVRMQSPVYKMHASNSPIRTESPKRVVSVESNLENQIENIYHENISLSRFGSEEKKNTKYPKVYVRKDLIQKREKEETVTLIKNMFSPVKSSSSHLNNILERSSEKYTLNSASKSQNGYTNTLSVVKTLDFDGNKKKKKDGKDNKGAMSKSELFDLEAQCEYQVGDLAWARMGTFPFWPCIITRDPLSGMFVKKKLFGRIERDVLHVTFFGDNGRRSWIVDSMIKKYLGQAEFEIARDQFTPEAKKKDPRLYAAYFVSEKKLPQWTVSVEEAEMLLREPKRIRIDILYDMLQKSRASKSTPKTQKSGKITRTDSDVSLSESLYDTLFSEDDGKTDDTERSRKKSRNKSLDVSEVVTACLDNMAAKTGITKIQRQSHMDRWLQKAKSKTPEKSQKKSKPVQVVEKEVKSSNSKKKNVSTKPVQTLKPYCLRKSNESQNLFSHQNEHDYSTRYSETLGSSIVDESDAVNDNVGFVNSSTEDSNSGLGIIAKVESLRDKLETNNVENDIIVSVNDNKSQAEISEVVDPSEVNVNETKLPNLDEEKNKVPLNDETEVVSNEVTTTNNISGVDENSVILSNIEQQSCESKMDTESIDESVKTSILNEKNDIVNPSQVLPFVDPSSIEESQGISNNVEFNEPINDNSITNSNIEEETILENRNILEDHENNVGSVYKKEPKHISGSDVQETLEKNENTESEMASFIESNEMLVDENISIENSQPTFLDADAKDENFVKKNVDECVVDNITPELSESNSNIDLNCKNTIEHIVKTQITENICKEVECIKKSQDASIDISIVDNNSTQKLNADILTNELESENIVTCIQGDNVQTNTVEECPIDPVHISDTRDTIDEIINDGINENLQQSEIKDQNIEIESDREENADFEDIESESNFNSSVNSNSVLRLSPEADFDSETFENQKIDADINVHQGFDSETVLNSESTKIISTQLNDKDQLTKTDIVMNIDQGNKFSSENDDIDKDIFNVVPIEMISAKPIENGFISGEEQDMRNNLASDSTSLDSEISEISDEKFKDNLNAEIDIVLNSVNTEALSTDEKDDFDKNIANLVPIEVLSSKTVIENGFNEVDEIDLEFNAKRDFDSTNSEHSGNAAEHLVNNGSYKEANTFDLEITNIEESKANDTYKSSVNLVPVEILSSATITENGFNENQEIDMEINMNHGFDSETASISSESSEKLGKNRKSLSLVKNHINKLKDRMNTDDEDTRSINSEISEISLSRRKLEITLTRLSEPIEKRTDEKKCDNTDDEKFDDAETASINSEDSDVPLARRILRSKIVNKLVKENGYHDARENTPERKIKEELIDAETASINSEDSEVSVSRRRRKDKKNIDDSSKALEDPEFVKYLELRQDALIDENPQLTQDEIVNYLYKTWLYEESSKSERKKTDDIENSNLIKGLNPEVTIQPKKIRRKIQKTEKEKEKEPTIDIRDMFVKEKPKRRNTAQPYYNEDLSDVEDEIKYFEIFNTKPIKKEIPETEVKSELQEEVQEIIEEIRDDEVDEVELYFEDLTRPKPNLFKGLIREKVCEYCEKTENLVKCKSCHGMFHPDCVKKEVEIVDVQVPSRGRKKKKKPRGRKPKSLDDSESQDDKMHDLSDETQNISVEEIIEPESHTVDAENFEAQLAEKMKELLGDTDNMVYDSYSSDDEHDWDDVPPGKCEIVDIKIKPKHEAIDHSNFKCKDCENNDTPVCFVCKHAVSKTGLVMRQRCQVIHCHKYYHLKCLDHWPQTQFNSGEPSRSNKKISEHFEALSCPRHVCHTCVSDDPRGCKTRFSGDKLARCVRCPATYHSFTKCLPAGTQILTGSQIICPRHYEHRPGKVPCHVNTGWCFICALGGSLICCEYCPTSFHAECLNIKPPEGGYMCEDCETGRLPLYGEMVWVKLGHYRWWPGIILHPSEIPDNIMAVKHTPGEFVVRFFGQYDHYWVNRGRVFPFQEGDSGRISSQKSKIDAAFTTAMEHAQRACEILKAAHPNDEESLDIASSLLPPHYVKLKVNKPCGSLRKVEVEESSLTQCECDPNEEDPCGAYSQCLNRMLLTECGPICRAGERCNNRAFEKRLYPKLVPYRTPHRGWGLKTLEDIKAGQFVIEYVGELIDEEEFKRRMSRKHEIRDENFYFLTLDKERMIDAGPKGNLARFMNHCCEPNCETQKWTVLGDVRVGLFALNDIPANSEVTFNYNLECAGIEKKRCLCGAKRCSGYIGAKPKQDESHKKTKIPGKRTYKKRKNIEESPSTKNKPKRPIGRPAKPRELTEIEKDLLIIKNATNGLSSDSECSSRLSSIDTDRKDHKALKRKRVSFSTDEYFYGKNSPTVKRVKIDDLSELGD